MMKKFILLAFALMFCRSVCSQKALSDYLPVDVIYNKDIPTPLQFFGHEPGELHLSHDRLLSYIKELASISDRNILSSATQHYREMLISVKCPFSLSWGTEYMEMNQVPRIHQ